MYKYFLIALLGLAAGCKTRYHDTTWTTPANQPPQMARHDGPRPPGPPGPGMNGFMHGIPRPMMMGQGIDSPTLLYFKEARQNLLEARTYGYITNPQYADLLEKLQSDMRQIFLAEAQGREPAPPMRMPMRRFRPGQLEDGGKPPKAE
jgi:hypothetical protein